MEHNDMYYEVSKLHCENQIESYLKQIVHMRTMILGLHREIEELEKERQSESANNLNFPKCKSCGVLLEVDDKEQCKCCLKEDCVNCGKDDS
jgi:hypothetical protein